MFSSTDVPFDTNDPFGAPDAPSRNGAFDFEEDVSSAALPPKGEYLIRCIEVQKGDSQSGNKQFIWDFVIVAAADGNSVGPGKQVRSWTALTDNAKWKVVEHVQALGVPVIDGKLKFNRSDVIGKCALAELEESTYNGRTSMKIKSMREAPSGVLSAVGGKSFDPGSINLNADYMPEDDPLK